MDFEKAYKALTAVQDTPAMAERQKAAGSYRFESVRNVADS